MEPFKERYFLEMVLGSFLLPFSIVLTKISILFLLLLPLSILILLHSLYISTWDAHGEDC